VSGGEFDLIRNYFRDATAQREDVVLGIGDDCALINVPAGKHLAVSMDTLVSGRHFIAEVDPVSLGHKALAVNLSDLAAMGAEPAWVTLSMTLPDADEVWQQWLASFMQGFSALAACHQVQLIGGDTTRGELTITVQAHGFLDRGEGLRRNAARDGDQIYVSGTLGDAGLALQMQQGRQIKVNDSAYLKHRLDQPTPRLALGRDLLKYATAAIDVSDGLVADLRHICTSSGVSAVVHVEKLPLSDAVSHYLNESGDWALPLAAGDDYELVFTVPLERQAAFEAVITQWDLRCTWIGSIEISEPSSQVKVVLPDGKIIDEVSGYDHFNA